MNPPKRFKDIRTEDLPAELMELGELLETIDSDRSQELLSSYHRVAESVLRRRRILGLVQIEKATKSARTDYEMGADPRPFCASETALRINGQIRYYFTRCRQVILA